MSISRLPVARSLDLVNFSPSAALGNIKEFFTKLMNSITRCATAIRNVVLWLYRAPSKLASLIAGTTRTILQGVKVTIVYTGTAALCIVIGVLAIGLSYSAIRFVRQARRSYGVEPEPRRIEEVRTQESIWRRAWDGGGFGEQANAYHRCREEIKEKERQTRRAADQKAKRAREAQERAQKDKETQQQRRQNVLREQRRLEDWKLYKRWRTACDEIFEAGTGPLPQPPSWPCSDISCRGERQLRACVHNLERLFKSTGNLEKTVKEEHTRWHPNRPVFYRLQPGSDKIATEITQAIVTIMR